MHVKLEPNTTVFLPLRLVCIRKKQLKILNHTGVAAQKAHIKPKKEFDRLSESPLSLSL